MSKQIESTTYSRYDLKIKDLLRDCYCLSRETIFCVLSKNCSKYNRIIDQRLKLLKSQGLIFATRISTGNNAHPIYYSSKQLPQTQLYHIQLIEKIASVKLKQGFKVLIQKINKELELIPDIEVSKEGVTTFYEIENTWKNQRRVNEKVSKYVKAKQINNVIFVFEDEYKAIKYKEKIRERYNIEEFKYYIITKN